MKTKIYSLQDENGSIRYIGKTTKNLNDRLSRHLCDARRGLRNHRCCWIRSVLSRGKWLSIFLIGEVEGNGCKEEMAWIKHFRDEGVNLVNETDGGEGMCGHKPTKETLVKMRIAAKKRSLTEEGKRNVRFARSKSSGNTGKKHSEKTCKQMSISAIKRGISPEMRRKLNESIKGVPHRKHKRN